MSDKAPPEEDKPFICPICGMAITELCVRIPTQRGTIDLLVPEEDNPLVSMNEVPDPIISCPECKQEIPEATLDKWKVKIDEI